MDGISVIRQRTVAMEDVGTIAKLLSLHHNVTGRWLHIFVEEHGEGIPCRKLLHHSFVRFLILHCTELRLRVTGSHVRFVNRCGDSNCLSGYFYLFSIPKEVETQKKKIVAVRVK
jgi:hypothetical protein